MDQHWYFCAIVLTIVIPCITFRVGSAGMFGVVAGTLFLYMSDWRVVVTKIPIYNSKFKDEEDSEKKWIYRHLKCEYMVMHDQEKDIDTCKWVVVI